MGTAHAELVEAGEKRDGRGRRLTPPERRAELVATYRQSGLTQTAFAGYPRCRLPPTKRALEGKRPYLNPG